MTVLDALRRVQGVRFANITYKNRQGEISKYHVNLGVAVENVYRADLETLKTFFPTNPIEKQALDSISESLRESLDRGIGNNSKYVHKETYEHLSNIPGCKVHLQTGEIHLLCMVEKKTVLVPGSPKKPVNSSTLTIAKKQIDKQLRRGKIREFRLNEISRLAANGEILEIECK